MINDEELIKNVEERIAYDNSQKDYAKRKRGMRRLMTTLCSLVLICGITAGVDAATDGAISSMFKAYIINPDGTQEEMPIEQKVDENGNAVYTFEQEFEQNGEKYTVKGEYTLHDGDVQFGVTNVYDQSGEIAEDVVVIQQAAHSEEEAEEFQKAIAALDDIPLE